MTSRTFAPRAAGAVIALAIGIAIAWGAVVSTGAFESTDRPVVGGLPLAAPARKPVYLGDVNYTFRGWATVWFPRNAFGGGSYAPAYDWTGAAWRTTSLGYGDRVWIEPFATNWSWAYSYERGRYLALHDSYVVIRWEYLNVAT